MAEPAIMIRPAHLADMAVIGEIVSESWQSTFYNLLPQDFLLSITPEAQKARHERTFARDDVHYLIASTAKAGDAVGFVSWGPARDLSFAMPYELYALYLQPGFERQGIGRVLLEGVISGIASSGKPGFYLTALALNPNLGFYVKLGGVAVDAPTIALGDASYRQVGFIWRLAQKCPTDLPASRGSVSPSS